MLLILYQCIAYTFDNHIILIGGNTIGYENCNMLPLIFGITICFSGTILGVAGLVTGGAIATCKVIAT